MSISRSSNFFGLNCGIDLVLMSSTGARDSHFFFLKVAPVALVLDHVTLKGVWVTHFGCERDLVVIGVVLCKECVEGKKLK